MTSMEIPADGEQTRMRSAVGRAFSFLALTKPIVVALLLTTTLAAMIVGAGSWPDTSLVLLTMLGGGLTAGGASALNQYIERDLDLQMARTAKRPLPRGTINPRTALIFASVISVLGLVILWVWVNWLTALMALVGWIYYVVLYSLILKPTTPQNIVVGGGAGAIPPLVGWAAATGQLSMPAFFLFAVVFFWTPPHFWALALLKRKDYARAGVPMLPVVIGEDETRWHIFLYSIQLVALSILLPVTQLTGGIYLIAALSLGIGFLWFAWNLYRQGGNKSAWKMYRYSSTYLALIFSALVLDTLV
jgi:protoheme IX farnesyltransferase